MPIAGQLLVKCRSLLLQLKLVSVLPLPLVLCHLQRVLKQKSWLPVALVPLHMIAKSLP